MKKKFRHVVCSVFYIIEHPTTFSATILDTKELCPYWDSKRVPLDYKSYALTTTLYKYYSNKMVKINSYTFHSY